MDNISIFWKTFFSVDFAAYVRSVNSCVKSEREEIGAKQVWCFRNEGYEWLVRDDQVGQRDKTSG